MAGTWSAPRPRGDLTAARLAVSKLVGRDTAKMDGAACTRAAIESLSENLTDGFVSPVFWYALGGLPGLIAVQGGEHHGFDGRLQDGTVSSLRMVRRAHGRSDELDSGADHVAAAQRGGAGCCRDTRRARA